MCNVFRSDSILLTESSSVRRFYTGRLAECFDLHGHLISIQPNAYSVGDLGMRFDDGITIIKSQSYVFWRKLFIFLVILQRRGNGTTSY